MNIVSNGLLFSNILPFFGKTLVDFSDFMTKPLMTVLSELSDTWAFIAKIVEKVLEAAGGVEWIEEMIYMPVGILLFGTGLILVLIISLVKWFVPII